MTRLDPGANGDDAAERPMLRRHPVVVETVLEVDDDAVRGEVAHRQRGGGITVADN